MPLGDSGRGPESFTKYASNLGLDAGTFKSCIESDKYLADIWASGQGEGAIEEKQGGFLEWVVGQPVGVRSPLRCQKNLEVAVTAAAPFLYPPARAKLCLRPRIYRISGCQAGEQANDSGGSPIDGREQMKTNNVRATWGGIGVAVLAAALVAGTASGELLTNKSLS